MGEKLVTTPKAEHFIRSLTCVIQLLLLLPWKTVCAGPCFGSEGVMETELQVLSVQGSADWHHEREDLVCLESDLADKYCKDRGENEKKGEKWPRVSREGSSQHSSHRLIFSDDGITPNVEMDE